MLFRCMIFIYSSIVEPADEEVQPRSEHKQEPKGLGAPPAVSPLAPSLPTKVLVVIVPCPALFRCFFCWKVVHKRCYSVQSDVNIDEEVNDVSVRKKLVGIYWEATEKRRRQAMQ